MLLQRVMMFLIILGLGMAVAAPASATTVGEAAPQFEAVDTRGNAVDLAALKGSTVVLEWKNHLCPFVKKHYGSGNMQGIQQYATDKGVKWYSIISSAEEKQGHVLAEEANEIATEEKSHATGIILDPSGEIGKLYDAKTTPHMFVVNAEGVLAYAGAIDSIPSPDPEDVAKAENYVKAAIDAVLAGTEPAVKESKAYGCSVKY